MRSSSTDSTSDSLLEQARAQVPGAWERLTALYCPLVYGWARRAGLGEEDAADTVQEVFLALVKHLSGFRHDRTGDTFRGWLWTITHSKIQNLRRHKRHGLDATGGTDAQQLLLRLPDQASGSSEMIGNFSGQLLSRALELIRSEFEPATWQAFWGVVVEDRSPADVASALGLSVNAVYIARSRILRRLRDELGEPPTGRLVEGGKP